MKKHKPITTKTEKEKQTATKTKMSYFNFLATNSILS